MPGRAEPDLKNQPDVDDTPPRRQARSPRSGDSIRSCWQGRMVHCIDLDPINPTNRVGYSGVLSSRIGQVELLQTARCAL